MRFLFKNGTEDQDLTAFPLFGRTELTMTYGEFVETLDSRAIRDVGTWCTVCGAKHDFCMAATADEDSDSSSASSDSGSTLSNAEAGAVGAAVTVGVLALVAGLVWLLMRRRRSETTSRTGSTRPGLEKIGSESSGSGSVV